ncbi:hypothetical protein [Levilactobacillus fujinensis]|uniref:Uncharacterized protein n=1 Tax=Levilactobacillus fujinensis TaxID=2486024 RepID=A0ABW1THK7_9LACO|nr:hypothetical protein [Levilactobacillus fujinensis]
MLTGLQIVGVMLTVFFYGWHWRLVRQLPAQSSPMRNRWRYLAHSFLLLTLLYIGLGSWRAAWLDERVLVLLGIVNATVLVARILWQRQHPFSATDRLVRQVQVKLLTLSQLSLLFVLLATFNILVAEN